jgi:uncharacterized protein YlxP (DUF503 family)
LYIGLLTVDCYIPGSRSLKDKRRVISALTARLRRRYNVALSEVEFQNQWQRARIALAFVNTDPVMGQKTISRVCEFFEQARDLEVLDTRTERLG